MPKALEVIGWLALVPLLALCATQWLGVDGRRTIAALQALTPFVLSAAIPISVVALLTKRYPMALVSMIPIVTLAVLAAPIVCSGGPPHVDAASPRVTIAFGNVLAKNTDQAGATAALAATDADVLVVAEFTPAMRSALDAAAGDDYPYRAERSVDAPSGIGLWSRFPIEGGVVLTAGRPTIDVVLDVDGRRIRVVGVHTSPPTHDAGAWSASLSAIGDEVEASSLPTVIVGDFNASRWHPSFRALLDRGWRDAHEAMGSGWSVSWPMDEGLTPPTFVRIDHALFGDGIAPTGLRDVSIPGSDHKGFVVEFGLTPVA